MESRGKSVDDVERGFAAAQAPDVLQNHFIGAQEGSCRYPADMRGEDDLSSHFFRGRDKDIVLPHRLVFKAVQPGTGKLPVCKSCDQVSAVYKPAAGRVDQIGAALHLRKETGIGEAGCFFI